MCRVFRKSLSLLKDVYNSGNNVVILCDSYSTLKHFVKRVLIQTESFLWYAKCEWCIESPEEVILFNILSDTTLPVIKCINNCKLDFVLSIYFMTLII